MPIPDGGQSLTICAFVSIQYQRVTDRRTDRFAITVSRSACIGMLTRDKNDTIYPTDHQYEVTGTRSNRDTFVDLE